MPDVEMVDGDDGGNVDGIDDALIQHTDLLRDDRGGAAENDGDYGGETQMAYIACEELAIREQLAPILPEPEYNDSNKEKSRSSLKLPGYLNRR